ncbi:hypothetical protein PIB30_084680 [Stylosanthes scabra]|uniref:Uncharacterized protein n=1 Tax=Stylosanthes scabra TaxID=79078 RepID=A0ABU6ZRE8_9FABA|nr:hypothetical protein [Stylosanthes scabra]
MTSQRSMSRGSNYSSKRHPLLSQKKFGGDTPYSSLCDYCSSGRLPYFLRGILELLPYG